MDAFKYSNNFYLFTLFQLTMAEAENGSASSLAQNSLEEDIKVIEKNLMDFTMLENYYSLDSIRDKKQSLKTIWTAFQEKIQLYYKHLKSIGWHCKTKYLVKYFLDTRVIAKSKALYLTASEIRMARNDEHIIRDIVSEDFDSDGGLFSISSCSKCHAGVRCTPELHLINIELQLKILGMTNAGSAGNPEASVVIKSTVWTENERVLEWIEGSPFALSPYTEIDEKLHDRNDYLQECVGEPYTKTVNCKQINKHMRSFSI